MACFAALETPFHRKNIRVRTEPFNMTRSLNEQSTTPDVAPTDEISQFTGKRQPSPTLEQPLNIESPTKIEVEVEVVTTDGHAPTPPYSVFTTPQKKWIVFIAALAGWFSTASSFIYFPAIPFLARDLGISIQKVNLAVVSYLVASGIFPAILGNAADHYGRRPVFIASIGAYVAINIGLAVQRSFAALVTLRMMQSMAISGTFSFAYGVLGDLTTPGDRGGYVGFISIFLNTPPSVAPSISGLLLIRWRWPAIFWFLAVLSLLVFAAMLLFLPETCRKLVGNGSVSLPMANKALLSVLCPEPTRQSGLSVPAEDAKFDRFKRATNPFTDLALLKNKGTGVCKLLDYDYYRTAKSLGISVDRDRENDIEDFPIEYARLRTCKYFIALCAPFIIGYGWALQAKVHMAVPLVLQFFIGFTNQVNFTSLNALLLDFHPDQPSALQAANNLVRCVLAAGGIALLDLLLKDLGPGWCFVLFAALHIITLPALWVIERYGMSWRKSDV
ncbi:hypothetical protein AJ79_03482 [Helicocarpus griseus UAMH5409]|uniref:Major facilitator superfamily (MFS) profile domain-containing protein n=1 Tax=Helicocarpus griseus UAMH5409 TaxID=1447875 RepID=A0A2B7XYT0_9EURO|nr:hypothetical protein AJ79_03482 [Helicocarpus griseus UAMH5409]